MYLQSKISLKGPLSQVVQLAQEGGALAPCLPACVCICGCRGTRKDTHGPTFLGQPSQTLRLIPRAVNSHASFCALSQPPRLHSSTPSRPASKVGRPTLTGKCSSHSYSATNHSSSGGERQSQWKCSLRQLPGPSAGRRCRGRGAGGESVAIWSEEQAEAAAAFAVARNPRRARHLEALSSCPDPQKQGSGPSLQLPGDPARAALRGSERPPRLRDPDCCPSPLSARCPGRRRLWAPRGPGRDRHTEPGPAVGAVGRLFSQLSPPPSPRPRGCALGRGSQETPPPPRYPRPSPLHTRTHYRAGSHTLARRPLRASVSAGVVPGPRSHHVHCLLLQFLSDPSSPAAEDAAQRRGLPARRPLRR